MKVQSNRPIGDPKLQIAARTEELKDLEACLREVEIFGDSDDLPADEWAIVFESNLPDEEMMAALRTLRAGKRVECKSFAGRMTLAGRIHAHALGIWLDQDDR